MGNALLHGVGNGNDMAGSQALKVSTDRRRLSAWSRQQPGAKSKDHRKENQDMGRAERRPGSTQQMHGSEEGLADEIPLMATVQPSFFP